MFPPSFPKQYKNYWYKICILLYNISNLEIIYSMQEESV